MEKHAFGIDLGTTFSSISIRLNKVIQVIQDNKGEKVIPSIIKYKDDEILVGNFAKSFSKQPSTTIFDSKRMLGRKYNYPLIQRIKDKWPFKIEQGENDSILIPLHNHKQVQPYEVTGEILKNLLEMGNERLTPECKTNKAVITIPANFGDEQRAETLKAAGYAGINVIQMINEPTAAGIAYSDLYNEKKGIQHFVIFDFGGGTLDISLLKVQNNEITVLATEGDMFLGGRDFDNITMDFLLSKLEEEDKNLILNNPRKKMKFLDCVVDTKKELSKAKEGTFYYDDLEFEYVLSLDEFESINKELINRIIDPVDRLLKSYRFNKEKVDQIILVGGSSRMQFVKPKLREYFGKEPVLSINEQEAVATGAGIIADQIVNNTATPTMKNNLKFYDICPFSIGIECFDTKMEIFIEKGQQIPTEKSKRFHTILYRQESFRVDIYEGEKEGEIHHIGNFSLTKLPASEKEVSFDIIFRINENCILCAEARLVDSNKHKSTVIDIKKIRSSKDPDSNESNEYKIFYMNVYRFITLNEKSFRQVYDDNEYNSKLNDALKNIKNAGKDEPKLYMLIKYYRDQVFRKYFIKYHEVPDFLKDI